MVEDPSIAIQLAIIGGFFAFVATIPPAFAQIITIRAKNKVEQVSESKAESDEKKELYKSRIKSLEDHIETLQTLYKEQIEENERLHIITESQRKTIVHLQQNNE